MHLLKTESQSRDYVISALKQEEIVILPTDTLYGFSGIMGETAGKIAAIKGRAPEKPFLALIAQPEDVYEYTDTVIPEQFFSAWPGPLTLIVPLKKAERKHSAVLPTFGCVM